jgi:hypothetical protein
MNTTEPAVCDFGVLLRDVLGFTDSEFVSLAYQVEGDTFKTAVRTPATAVRWTPPEGANAYFGVCPTKGPSRKYAGRGKAVDVTRLTCLFADLDVKPGACGSLDIAKAIAAELGIQLGTRPMVTVESGGGLHIYFPITDGAIGEHFTVGQAQTLVRRWGRLVAVIADNHDAHVDNVFDFGARATSPG